MSNFLIICGSNTVNSQNYIVTKLLKNCLEEKFSKFNSEVIFLDLLTNIPFISHQLLNSRFFPDDLIATYECIEKYKNLIFVVPEHNSNLNSFFKNIFDWWTVKNTELLKDKQVVLISASKTKKIDRGIEITGKLTFQSVGCTKYYFVNWNNEKAMTEFQKIIQKITEQ